MINMNNNEFIKIVDYILYCEIIDYLSLVFCEWTEFGIKIYADYDYNNYKYLLKINYKWLDIRSG
jgi:hypothetical protein